MKPLALAAALLALAACSKGPPAELVVPVEGAPIAGVAAVPVDPAPPAPATAVPSTALPAPQPALGDTSTLAERAPQDDPVVVAQVRTTEKRALPDKPGTKDDPAAKKPEAVRELDFELLAGFEYIPPEPEVPDSQAKSDASIPKDIRALDGQTVSVTGYMIPMEYSDKDDGVKSFLLSRHQMGCCFGVVPKAHELVEVDMGTAKSAPYVSWVPTRIIGVLHVGRDPGATTALSGIYRMYAPKVESTANDQFEEETKDDGSR